MTPTIRQIPVLHLSYGNEILRRIGLQGPSSVDQLLAAGDPESLFKGEREHRAPRERLMSIVRFSEEVGLLRSQTEGLTLTDAGREYVESLDPDDPFAMTEGQAAVL